MKYEVVLYDLLNDGESWYVNDVHPTGRYIEVEDVEETAIDTALKQAGFDMGEFEIDHGGDSDGVIYILDNMGDPYFELREVAQ